MKFKILVILATASLVVLGTGANGQGLMRGEAPQTTEDFTHASQQQLQMELLVEEIEEAGFELDVEEGFEEEWEEEIWVSADEDEIDAMLVDPDDAAFPDEDEFEEEEEEWEEIYVDELMDTEESPEDFDILYADAGMNYEEEIMIWADSEEEEFEELLMGQEWEDDFDEEFDPDWEEIMDEWEIEEMEFEMEDDLDLMEEIYNAG